MALGEYYCGAGPRNLRHDGHLGRHRPDHALRRHRADVHLRLHPHRLRPQRQALNEAALKYFLLGIFSTAILVYGMAWLYGMTGYTNLRQIGGKVAEISRLRRRSRPTAGWSARHYLLIAGLGFKIAAVPFHMWTPDAYQGAPTPVTAFMSVGPKAAGFAATIRILTEALGPAWQTWVPIIIVLSRPDHDPGQRRGASCNAR